MNARILRRTSCVLLALAVSAIGIAAAEEQQQAQSGAQSAGPSGEATMALWRERDLDFTYRSSVVTHTCQDLRYRVATVLVALGARPDIRVSADNCDAVLAPEEQENRPEPWRPPNSRSERFGLEGFGDREFDRKGQYSRVRIHLTSPVEVTPAAVQEWKKDRSKRELIARVTGNPSPLLETTGQFPAEWQTVTLTRRTADLEPEDCALLEQLSSSVLRQLAVRKVRMSGHCDPRHPSHIPPQLTVEALVSNPYGSAAPAKEDGAAPEQGAPPKE